METNPQDYDRRASWIPRQNQRYEGRVATLQDDRQHLTRPQPPGQPQRVGGQKPAAPQKMPKTRVLALANTLKRWLAIASIVSFGTFGGLVALHQVGTTATASTTTTKTSSTTSQTSSSQVNKNFLKQGGNNIGSSQSSQTATSTATATPTNTATSTATPVTSSSTS